MNESPVVVAGIQVPSDPEAPITLDFRAHALRMAIVDRHRVSRLPAGDWDAPGVYVLVDPPAQPEITVYVGQARKLRHRLGHHARRREGWWRALAVQRDDRHGFNTAEIGYLEGRLTSELKALPGTAVDAGKADIDTTLPQHERAHLDAFVPTILAGLRVVGLRSEHERLRRHGRRGPGGASRAPLAICSPPAFSPLGPSSPSRRQGTEARR